MKLSVHLLWLLVLAAALEACSGTDHSNKSSVLSESAEVQNLPDPWYAGTGEISTYTLEQNRYNAVHPGKMTTVFVTEDFLTDKQVKNDSGKSKNSVGVLKMNKIRRFTTGLYDYSLYTSVYTDTKKAKTYKVTTSTQDWCGQSYMQLNRERDKYNILLRSYFESEGDQSKSVKTTTLEDELPLLIRLNPKLLPLGSFYLLQAQEYAMLKHIDMEAVEATGSISPAPSSVDSTVHMTYTVEIPSHNRVLTYTYLSGDPTRPIVEWTDSHPSAFDGKVRTTRASLINTEWLPYWQLNGESQASMRSSFRLGDF